MRQKYLNVLYPKEPTMLFGSIADVRIFDQYMNIFLDTIHSFEGTQSALCVDMSDDIIALRHIYSYFGRFVCINGFNFEPFYVEGDELLDDRHTI